MDVPASHIASSIAGAYDAKTRDASRKSRAKRTDPTPDPPNKPEEVDEVETAEAVRSAKGNEQEETREDRQAHGFYDQRGAAPGDQAPRRLDLEG